jgi:hypothetical protein
MLGDPLVLDHLAHHPDAAAPALPALERNDPFAQPGDSGKAHLFQHRRRFSRDLQALAVTHRGILPGDLSTRN